MKTYAYRCWLFALGFMLSLGAAQAAYADCSATLITGSLSNETNNPFTYASYTKEQGDTPSIGNTLIPPGSTKDVFTVCSVSDTGFGSTDSVGRLQFFIQGTNPTSQQVLAQILMNYDASQFQCALDVQTLNGVSVYKAPCPKNESDVSKCACTVSTNALSAILPLTNSPTNN